MVIITDYKVVTGWNVEDLEKQVKELIKEFWQPHGNLFFSPDYADLIQPMVKWRDTEEHKI